MRLNPDCMRAVLLEVEKAAYGQSMTAIEIAEALPKFSWILNLQIVRGEIYRCSIRKNILCGTKHNLC